MESTASTGSPTEAEIREFTIDVPEEQLEDLRSRIEATRWPDGETDPSQGVRLKMIQALAGYWATDYDWRKFEERFAALHHYITEIDGIDVHFIHVRSEHEDALPLVVTHGWPGSTVEQLEDHRSAHRSHCARRERVGRLRPRDPLAAGPRLLGEADRDRLGPDSNRTSVGRADGAPRLRRYVAQGGDWGNAVTEQLALLKPPGLLGIHTNMPATVPPDVSKALASGGPEPSGLSAEEKNAYEILKHFFATGVGYANEMANRPQTLYGIADSPVGLAAWMLDHDVASYELIERAFVGQPGGISRDDVLDNATHYWLTNTGVSSARLYWESHLAFFDVKGVEIPVGVTVFPDELYPAPRSWAEQAYPKLIHFNEVDEGGHFAAWEQPQTLSEELRATFRSLR